jgi:hypothetical protein
MNEIRIEPLLERLLTDAPTQRAPESLRADIARATGHVRRRPPWLAYLKEPPMRFRSRLVVGSPRIRIAAVVVAVAVLLTLGGAALAASSLVPGPTSAAPPYLTNFCDLASLDEVRGILGDDAATVVHGEGRSLHTGLDACVWRAEVPDERVLGVQDWAPSMYDMAKSQPGAFNPDGTLTPVAGLGDDAFVVTSPAEADLYVKKGARAAWVFYRPSKADFYRPGPGENAAQLQQIATQMGTLVAERMSGAPSAVGDLCQLLTPDDIRAALPWTGPNDAIGATSFATHCDWLGLGATDYLSVYDVPMADFDASKSLGGTSVPGMGDEAFVLTVDNQPTLYIRKGDRAAAISTPHLSDMVQEYSPDDELKIGAVVAERLAAPSQPILSSASTTP